MTTQDVAVKMEKAISDSEYSSRSMVKFVLVGEVDVDCEINTDLPQGYVRGIFLL